MTSLEQKGDIAIYDAFNTYMDIDFLRRTVIEEDVETKAMSNLDFFQHYIKPEPVNYKEDNYDSMCAVCPSSLTENSATSTQKAGQPSRPLVIATKNFDTDNVIKQNENNIDQKMSLKERRKLRNKISARNFRARRKEYIQHLEATVQEQQNEILLLNQTLAYFKESNSRLTHEVEQLREGH
ncbi:5014_t:CDS:2 [Paraglomus brasilianum]|uniref:5014_t:CDS:1 n=1 Tax=Paraglomus brasilianum TaxID=144538 RepID=A0A9N8ZDJ3_9GLOM|nr:5014_t:CDS:2 [Paraglomus brasilianum]